MPIPHSLCSLFCVAIVLASAANAQERGARPEGERGREGRPPMRMMNPIFAALDVNGDGIIDSQEIAMAAESLKKLDRNGDGQITEDEVRPAFGGRGGPGERGGPGGGNPEEMVTRMLQYDKNGDGKLSKDELPERMQGMMERGDTDKDGFLSREELLQLARSQAQSRGGPGGERGRGSRGEGERQP